MPTFFSKVFSRGKDKDKEKGQDGGKESTSPTTKQGKRASIHSLLEGKFEAVSPAISPSASKQGDNDNEKELEKAKEKEKPSLFRPLSRTKATGSSSARKPEDAPHLTLNLSLSSLKDDSKKSGNLDVVYESVVVLSDAELGEKRLNASEALKLMRACSNVIASRGLETLGIMHPHWYSSSPAIQRKVISLYLGSLIASQTSSPATSSSNMASAFDYELEYARDPHDVAAVFRWALRHLRLDGDSFGNDGTNALEWYDSFSGDEKNKGYPPTAYSDILLPLVKPINADLLNVTLSLFSSLASHSETNGVSGSRLSMSLGYYLLTGNKVDGPEDWPAFYASWERAGRALEHIFLANLRDEDSKTKVPKRLAELIAKYPYPKLATDERFPRPAAFATRAYDALYVQITSELPLGTKPSLDQRLPLKVVETALKSDSGDKLEDAEVLALWEELKKASATPSGGSESIDQSETLNLLSRILSDDTVSMLSLKSDRTDEASSTVTMFTAGSEVPPQSSKPSIITNGKKAKSSNGAAVVSRNISEATTEQQSPITSNWDFFSSAGFGESSAGQSLAATLMDSDLEKTQPPAITPRRSQKKRGRSPTSKAAKVESTVPSTPIAEPKTFKSTIISVVKVDEAFVDFWNDALIDPVSDSWPSFVVCQLKPSLSLCLGDTKITYLVIDQKFVAPPPPPAEEPPSPVRRASSPKPSLRGESDGRPSLTGRVSSTFSATRKRFNFFGGGTSDDKLATTESSESKEAKKSSKGVKVGEMGEIIQEEPVPSSVKDEAKTKEESAEELGKDAAAAGVAVAATAEKTQNAIADGESPAEPTELEEKTKVEAVPEPAADIKDEVIATTVAGATENGTNVAEINEEIAVAVESKEALQAPASGTNEDTISPTVVVSAKEEEVAALEAEPKTAIDVAKEETLVPLVDDRQEVAAPVLEDQAAPGTVKEIKETENVAEAKEVLTTAVAETKGELKESIVEVAEGPSVPAEGSQAEAPPVISDELEHVPVHISETAKEGGQPEPEGNIPHAEEVPVVLTKTEVDAPSSVLETEETSEVPPTAVEEPTAVPTSSEEPLAKEDEKPAESEVVAEVPQELKSEETTVPSEIIVGDSKPSEEVQTEQESSVVEDEAKTAHALIAEKPKVLADETQKTEIAPEATEEASASVEPETAEPTIETIVREPVPASEELTSVPPVLPSERSEDATITEATKEEKEETASHRGADGSRFVEHLHTPPEQKPAELEPVSVDGHEQDTTPATSAAPDVPVKPEEEETAGPIESDLTNAAAAKESVPPGPEGVRSPRTTEIAETQPENPESVASAVDEVATVDSAEHKAIVVEESVLQMPEASATSSTVVEEMQPVATEGSSTSGNTHAKETTTEQKTELSEPAQESSPASEPTEANEVPEPTDKALSESDANAKYAQAGTTGAVDEVDKPESS